jgi:hypothetical protein
MLAGIGMLVVSAVAADRMPRAWTRTAALLIICGALAELLALHRFSRGAGTRQGRRAGQE